MRAALAFAAAAVVLALVGGARASGTATIVGSVVPNPLEVSLALSSASTSVGTSLTANATARNLGASTLQNVVVTLKADPGISISGGTTRTITALGGHSSAQVSWPICPLSQGNYLIVASGESGAFKADSAAQLLTVTPSSSPCSESASATLPAGGTLTTDPEGDGASPADPVETSVRTPIAGVVSIDERSASPTATAYAFLGLRVQIAAPAATPTNPLLLRFRLDASVLPGKPVQVFRDGVVVADCPGDPCVAARSVFADGDVELTVRTSRASRWTFGSAIVTRGAAAGSLQTSNRHVAVFAIAFDGAKLTGAFAFDAYRATVTALAVSGRTAWFAGLGTDRRPFLAYVEDNGANGRGDVFRLWIGGVAQTSDGRLASGDVRVAQ